MHYFARIAVTYTFAVIALFCVANKASAMPLIGCDEKGNEIRVHNVDKYLAEKPKPKPKPKPRATVIATKPKKKPPAPKKIKPKTKWDWEDFAGEVAGTSVAGAITGSRGGPAGVAGGATIGAVGGAAGYATKWATKNRKFMYNEAKGAMDAMDPMGEFIH